MLRCSLIGVRYRSLSLFDCCHSVASHVTSDAAVCQFASKMELVLRSTVFLVSQNVQAYDRASKCMLVCAYDANGRTCTHFSSHSRTDSTTSTRAHEPFYKSTFSRNIWFPGQDIDTVRRACVEVRGSMALRKVLLKVGGFIPLSSI
jgi:hypothetical protein